MGLSQITLTNYDTVVAVTQDTINEMFTYLYVYSLRFSKNSSAAQA